MQQIKKSFVLLVIGTMLMAACEQSDVDWAEYLGGPDRNHFANIDQINADNVTKLTKVWEYHTGDSGQSQCNAIIQDGILFGMTASSLPFALDAATGQQIWKIEGGEKKWYSSSRGVAVCSIGDEKRLFYTRESELFAVDALTGDRILTFGDSGKVSLKTGLGENARDKFVISSTPGTIFEDLIIMPLRISEGADAAPGYIQAFNTRTGNLEWTFRTIPHPGEEGYETWPAEAYKNTNVGGANNWAGMSIDRDRGLLFVPTGSAAFDFFGGNRKGDNLFANTLLALNARTGKKVWHYQLVHHDILDRDLPAPPNLVTVTRNGKRIDAVAQVTKHGYIFLFNRETGEPLFDIEERAVPKSDIPGEYDSPTQPFPVKPLPFTRQSLSIEDLNPDSPNKDELASTLKKSRSEGPFTPLSKNGTIIFPGLDGGAEWGGAAVDREGILYVNSNEMPWLISLQKDTASREQFASPGAKVYTSKCAACHGADRKGNQASGFSSLVNVGDRLTREHVLNVVSLGKGMMPAFKSISEDEKKQLIAFLYGDKIELQDKQEVIEPADAEVTWRISGYTKFLDANGNPAIKPPWGTLNAIDLNTGEYLWKNVFGEPPNGSESYGGPITTASGLLIIAGTKDQKLRIYNKKTGHLLCAYHLPTASFATPSTYVVNGKQYIVLSCGGTKLGAGKGDSYVAFALKD